MLIGTSGLLTAAEISVDSIIDTAREEQDKFKSKFESSNFIQTKKFIAFGDPAKQLLQAIKEKMGENKEKGAQYKKALKAKLHLHKDDIAGAQMDIEFLKKHYSLVKQLIKLENKLFSALQLIVQKTSDLSYKQAVLEPLDKLGKKQEEISIEAGKKAVKMGKPVQESTMFGLFHKKHLHTTQVALWLLKGKNPFTKYYAQKKAFYTEEINKKIKDFNKLWESIGGKIAPEREAKLLNDYADQTKEATRKGEILGKLKLPLFENWKKTISESFEAGHKGALKQVSRKHIDLKDMSKEVEETFEAIMKKFETIYAEAFEPLEAASAKLKKRRKRAARKKRAAQQARATSASEEE